MKICDPTPTAGMMASRPAIFCRIWPVVIAIALLGVPTAGAHPHGNNHAPGQAKNASKKQPAERPAVVEQDDDDVEADDPGNTATVGNIAAIAAADYRARSRFPSSSWPLRDSDLNPISRDRDPTEQSLPGAFGASPRLAVSSGSSRYEKGDFAFMYARLVEADDSVIDEDLLLSLRQPENSSAAANRWSVRGEFRDETGRVLARLKYRDDGNAGDAAAGDGLFTARRRLPASYQPAIGKARSIAVAVTATDSDGDTRSALGGFLYSNPAATMTGKVRDRLDNGSLVVEAEVKVEAPGRVHLSATLNNVAGQPVAMAQNAMELSVGKHWVPLRYYGLIFHDRGLSGPYELAEMTLSSTMSMPNALGAIHYGMHRTAPYDLAQFTSVPFNRPDLIDAAERLAPANDPDS